ILFLIFKIFSNPSGVKCSLFFINSAASQKSIKSNALIPSIGYFLKNGIILSFISANLSTLNSPLSRLDSL
ncbi:MAG TPA: hypothetical protein VGD23_10580, partial [Sphingomicrobium sp.]